MGDLLLDDVQRVLDKLSNRIRRSVALDEPDGTLITSTRHHGDEDGYRRRLVLAREISPEVRSYLAGFALTSRREPVRIPALPSQEFNARVCYPIRSASECLALLWVYDDGTEIPDLRIMAAYPQLVRALEQRKHINALSAQPRRRLLELALSSGRTSGALELALIRYGLDQDDKCQFAVAVHAGDARDASSISQTAEGLARALLASHADTGAFPVEGTPLEVSGFAASVVFGAITGTESGGVSDQLRTLIPVYAPGAGCVGVSSVSSLRLLRKAFAEASLAALVGDALFPVEPAIMSEELGGLAALLRMIGTLRIPTVQRLEALVDSDEMLSSTLECYLRNSGDTSRTAAELIIHRTTLYYRLEQISKRTGIDLADGRQRTLAHLFIMAKEVGQHPLAPAFEELSSQV